MNAAQVAVSALVAVLVAGATVILVTGTDDAVVAWIMIGFALFGYLTLLAMIVTDRRPPGR